MPDLPRTSYLCPVTIGRNAEIDALRAFLARDHGVLLISGEAGIGKSRLVQEAQSIAEAAGCQVLVGRSFEADRVLPFAPAIDVLQTLVELHGRSEVARRAGPAAADLARLLPELLPGAAPAVPASPDTESAKRRLLDAFARLMLELAKQQPLLLVVEDIHWPDASSLDLLVHLARRTSRGRLFLLLTYRSDEVHPELGHLLATLDRERLATEISLDRLDALQVAAMLQAISAVPSSAPATLLHAICSLTDGNPFFIEEILTALGAKQRLVTPDGRWDQEAILHPHIPRSVQDAVLQRTELLSEAARDVLTLAAVAGRRFDFELLGAISGTDESALLELVRELISAQLVVEEGGDRFVFRHALTREAIHARLLDRQRRRLHRQIADTIAQHAPAPAEQRLDDLSDHYYAAGAWPEALEASRRAAARAAALHAPRVAAEHYSRAIEAAKRLSRPADAALHQARGHAFETLGEFDNALADYHLAFDVAQASGDLPGQWQALLNLSLLWSSRDYGEAGAYATRALEVARALGDSLAIARSLNRLGNWQLNLEEPRQAIQRHREALAILESLDDMRGLAETLDLLGLANFIGADTGEGAAAYDRAVGIWRDLADRRGLAGSLIGCVFCGFSFHTNTIPTAERREQVHANGTESLLLSRDIGWRAGESLGLWSLHGMVHGALGSYGTALPGARQALVIAEEIDHQQWITAARCMLGNIYADLGAFSAASAELQAALEIARHIGSPYWIRSAAGWLASTFVHAGDLARASAVLNAEFGDETPLDTLAGRLLWCAAAEYALGAGEPDKALDMIRWLVDATPANTRQPIPRLEKIRGEALATVGRSEEAAEAFGIARAEAASIGARPLLWRIETSLGQLFRAAGFAEDARHAFTSAQTIVSELATSIPDAELRETFLTWAAGTLPKGYPRSGSDVAGARDSPLTKRELQVAALLKDGLTNREIGERLFLSEWTAATHVRNILAKLGLSSRAQIAAWAASRDGAPRA